MIKQAGMLPTFWGETIRHATNVRRQNDQIGVEHESTSREVIWEGSEQREYLRVWI